MSPERPLPEFWYPIARILLMLKALLAGAQPTGYGAIAAQVHRELIYAGAFVRRYLLALARELALPPLRPRAPASPDAPRDTPPRRFRLDRPLTLAEPPVPKRPRGPSPPPVGDAYVEWALALQRAEALLAALRQPLPIAKALARRLARGQAPVLREAALPWHVLRALPPWKDILLMRLDQRARPSLWAGLEIDTG